MQKAGLSLAWRIAPLGQSLALLSHLLVPGQPTSLLGKGSKLTSGLLSYQREAGLWWKWVRQRVLTVPDFFPVSSHLLVMLLVLLTGLGHFPMLFL